MKITFLSPVPFSHTQNYFKEFFNINKIKNAAFSYRFFAGKIKWPASYLSDLISGRKYLTIQRALQFADFFKMNSVDKEHLLWLAISHSKKESTENIIAYDLKTTPNSRLYENNKNDDSFLLSDLVWVSRIILWKKQKMTAEQILENFEICSISQNRLKKALEKLDDFLNWNPDGSLQSIKFELPGEFDHSDTKGDKRYEGIELHRDYVANFLKFIENPKSPSTYHSHIVAIPQQQFMIIAMKIIDLRNWIDEISREHFKESTNLEKTSFLMQLDLNLFPLQKMK